MTGVSHGAKYQLPAPNSRSAGEAAERSIRRNRAACMASPVSGSSPNGRRRDREGDEARPGTAPATLRSMAMARRESFDDAPELRPVAEAPRPPGFVDADGEGPGEQHADIVSHYHHSPLLEEAVVNSRMTAILHQTADRWGSEEAWKHGHSSSRRYPPEDRPLTPELRQLSNGDPPSDIGSNAAHLPRPRSTERNRSRKDKARPLSPATDESRDSCARLLRKMRQLLEEQQNLSKNLWLHAEAGVGMAEAAQSLSGELAGVCEQTLEQHSQSMGTATIARPMSSLSAASSFTGKSNMRTVRAAALEAGELQSLQHPFCTSFPSRPRTPLPPRPPVPPIPQALPCVTEGNGVDSSDEDNVTITAPVQKSGKRSPRAATATLAEDTDTDEGRKGSKGGYAGGRKRLLQVRDAKRLHKVNFTEAGPDADGGYASRKAHLLNGPSVDDHVHGIPRHIPKAGAAMGRMTRAVSEEGEDSMMSLADFESKPEGKADRERTFLKKMLKDHEQSLMRSRTSITGVAGGLLPSRTSSSQMIDKVKVTMGESKQKAVFMDTDTVKRRIRDALTEPEYNVFDFYKERGFPSWLAKQGWFEYMTLIVISFNAFWIAVETDHTDSALLTDTPMEFQLVGHAICFYFTGEITIRWLAFQSKCNAFKDAWFCIDFSLVVVLILETWVVTLVVKLATLSGEEISNGLKNMSIVRMLRLLRLARMARLARLIRALPELMILIKGMIMAMRTVFFTIILLSLVIYIFAIVMTQTASNTAMGQMFFADVGTSASTLLLHGCFVDDFAEIVKEAGRENLLFAAVLVVFVLVASLTIMNMLVGVLVEVVSVTASVEKEELQVGWVKQRIEKTLASLDSDSDGAISREEFKQLLYEPTAAKALHEVGVDVVSLVDYANYIFEEGDVLSFADFMECVLQLRGQNTATVKDIVDLRKVVVQEVSQLKLNLEAHLSQMNGNYLSQMGELSAQAEVRPITRAKYLTKASTTDRM
eukprot:TRINITY_DN3439_c0_g1_i1.p1 TRINITY_DN3439_c0_g1~~TRINITY_DN3439_c0_g1_i1.p1  ORF type:complete len:989 (-),score=223.09 TRINITY_DN3439_c0_g1_i1:260-3226(-)